MSSLEGPMTRLEAIINFSTGVLLPTIDVSSDLTFAIRFLAKKTGLAGEEETFLI